MNEKMLLLQRDGKLKEIKMFGQISLEGDLIFYGDEELLLVGKDWNDQLGCQKRLTPNSIGLKQTGNNTFRQVLV